MLQIVAPKSELLKNYVDTFYVFNAAAGEQLRYVAFPHTNTGLSFFKDVSIQRANHQINIQENKSTEPSFCIEMLGKYTQPVVVCYTGAIDEISIVFKPLGINRFVREDLSDIASQYAQAYPNNHWLAAAPKLFSAQDKIEALEQFLLSLYQEQAEFQTLEAALALLHDTEEEHSIAAIARQLHLNLKTFQRSFTKQLACSPSEYKRIAKFRNALNTKFKSTDIKTLTSIAYQNNYSDQSYFIREFKKLTHQSPKHFFKEVSLVDGDKIVWEIL